MPVEKLYDAAVSMHVIHIVKDQLTLLQEIARRLQPGEPHMF
ncbi:methyltransferase domain-containing protein, partial [Bacillus sp. PsM16]